MAFIAVLLFRVHQEQERLEQMRQEIRHQLR